MALCSWLRMTGQVSVRVPSCLVGVTERMVVCSWLRITGQCRKVVTKRKVSYLKPWGCLVVSY